MLKSVSEHKPGNNAVALAADLLTIDVGNSSLTWGAWQQGRLMLADFSDYEKGGLESVLDTTLAGLDRMDDIWVACVAGELVEAGLRLWFERRWQASLHFLRTSQVMAGVVNGYEDPSMHGVDRWAALLGARHLYRQPVCVIDVGTAVTVDLMDAQGVHQGGRIMPGLAMMHRALRQQTAGISEVEGECPDFAINTADAVTSGTLHMLSAGLDEVSSAARKYLGVNMKTIITGGLAEKMLPQLNIPELHHEPYLILQGLYLASQQDDAAGSTVLPCVQLEQGKKGEE